MSERVITESILINRPQQDVWNHITTAENWKIWYSNDLTDVSPGWQKGATLSFKSGHKPVIEQCERPNILQWGGGVFFRLSEQDSSSTMIEYGIPVRGMFAEDLMLLAAFKAGFIDDAVSMLKKIKSLLES